MKFFFVGDVFNTRADRYVKRRLMSFWKRSLNYAQLCTRKGDELFLDSGAFSAYNKGREIDVARYVKFIHNSEGIWDHIANLDYIAPKGVSLSLAAERSYRNLRQLEELGCRVIPVYHAGEPRRYLERYAEEYPYIALGGLGNGTRPEVLRSALDWCWDLLTHKDGTPRVKVHGFGKSAYWLVARYPWYSVDSRTWLIDSDRAFKCRAFIDGQPRVFDVRREALPKEVEARFGVTTKECRTEYDARLLVNAAYHRELENHAPDRYEYRRNQSTRNRSRKVHGCAWLSGTT